MEAEGMAGGANGGERGGERDARGARSSRTPRTALAVLAVLVVEIGGAGSARAWRQYRTSSGQPMRWSKADRAAPVPFGVDETGLSEDGVSAATLAIRAKEALGAWEDISCVICPADGPQEECGDLACGDRPLGLRFVSLGLQPARPVGLGCEDEKAGECVAFAPNGNQVICVHDASDWPFGALVLAMTLLSAESDTGHLADVDIALNDAGFTFCDDDCGEGAWPLAPMLLHEAGHFIGLDHSLRPQAVMRPAPVDRSGAGALRADDRRGACAVYPAPEATAVCALPEQPADPGSGCASASGAAPPASLCLLFLFALGVAASRRAVRPPSCPPSAYRPSASSGSRASSSRSLPS